MAHTPGPWVVAGESGNTGEAFVIESDKRTVCWTADSTDEEWEERGGVLGTDEDRANARLIAAAPDMLDALRAVKSEFIDMYEECYPNDESDNDVTAAIDMVIAAIAKAEGRSE